MRKAFYTKYSLVYTLFWVFLGGFFLSNSGGYGGNASGSPAAGGFTCAGCHGGGTTAGGSVVLTGAPSTYVLGATYALTLKITDPDAVLGGFQVMAYGSGGAGIGTFSYPTGTNQPGGIAGLIGHSTTRAFSMGMATWTFNWTAPSSGNQQVTFYFVGNATNGNGGSSGDAVYASSTASIPLPIVLSNLRANMIDRAKGVNISWETALEWKNSYFEVQRSTDGISFENVGTINSKVGYSLTPQNYSFLDNKINNLTREVNNLYYRLLQVDFDGKITTSPVVAVALPQLAASSASLFPNPIRRGQEARLVTSEAVQNVEMYNIQGVKVANLNASNGTFVTPMDVPNGIYFVYFSSQTNPIRLVVE